MTIDPIQLLRDHWDEVPEADEETVRRAYADAICSRSDHARLIRDTAPRGHALSRYRWPAICAAAAELVATGTNGGGETPSSPTRRRTAAMCADRESRLLTTAATAP